MNGQVIIPTTEYVELNQIKKDYESTQSKLAETIVDLESLKGRYKLLEKECFAMKMENFKSNHSYRIQDLKQNPSDEYSRQYLFNHIHEEFEIDSIKKINEIIDMLVKGEEDGTK